MNLSVLDQNILHSFSGLKHGDEAERVYFASRDKLPPAEAERAALRWEASCRIIVPSVALAQRQHDGRDHGALDFMRTRYMNMTAAA